MRIHWKTNPVHFHFGYNRFELVAALSTGFIKYLKISERKHSPTNKTKIKNKIKNKKSY